MPAFHRRLNSVIALNPRSHRPPANAHGERTGAFVLDFLVLTLVLNAPLAVLLRYHGYSYLNPEVLSLAISAAGAATILALLIGWAGQLARTIVFAVVLTLFIDVQLGLRPMSWATVLLLFLAAVTGIGAILWLLREHATKIVGVIFSTLLVLTLLTVNSSSQQISRKQGAATRDGDAPLLIHLLLDEHIGVEGLPLQIPGARQLHGELIDFYTSRGFRLFGGAYSQYANTYNSLTSLLNFPTRASERRHLAHGEGQTAWALKEATYLKLLQQRGYRLHVYQSTYMNLCDAEDLQKLDCVTYPAASLGSIENLQLPTAEKARAIFATLYTRSRALRVLNKVYHGVVRATAAYTGWQLPVWYWEPPSFGPLPVPQVFASLSDDVLAHPRGHAFFAHLLLPHYPYAFDDRCELRPRMADWLTNRIGSSDSLVYNTAESRAQRYELYAEQIRCVLTLLDGLLSSLESRGLLDDATIIVHGDHGSRIATHFPSGRTLQGGVLTDSDYADTFSTLYAIRAPSVPTGYDTEPSAVVDLLNHHLTGEPLPADDSCRVFLVAKSAELFTTVEPKFCARHVVTTRADGGAR